ncbi:D-alanyl-D-alanine carboxypeptidase family protein [Gordonia sp. NPDC003429]
MRSSWRRRIGSVAAGIVVGAALCSPAAAWMGAPPAHAEPAAGPITTPFATPDTDRCPHRVTPPAAVDESEVVAPGSSTPAPLPVPNPAVGGEALSACGVIAEPGAGPIPQRLTSAAWLVADLDSGAVIAAKDPHGRYRPASTIKVLLALAVLRAGIPMDRVVTATPEDWSAEGDSCGLGPGGHYTVRDMMIGLLMVSGNDCAHVLARELGGVDTTLETMNSLAHSLHADDTRAASPSGLDAAGMSTSPYDLALIFRAAMAEPAFREFVAMPTYRFPGYPKRADVPGDTDHPAYMMQTSNHLVLEGDPGALGGKTGYTDDALKTYVGAVHRDGRTVLVVQMYGLSTADDNYWTQARSLVDYGVHAGREYAVGRLVSPVAPSPDAAPTTDAPRDTRAATQRAAAGQDQAPKWSIRILIGLLCALAALGSLAVGLRLFSRR